MTYSKRFYFFIWMLVQTAITLSQTGTFDTEKLAALERKAYSDKQRPLLGTAQNNYNIFYTRCNWKVDPNINYIKGDITTFFKPESPGFNVIEFDLSKLLTVDSVVYHGTKISFVHQNTHVLKINLPQRLPSVRATPLGFFIKVYLLLPAWDHSHDQHTALTL